MERTQNESREVGGSALIAAPNEGAGRISQEEIERRLRAAARLLAVGAVRAASTQKRLSAGEEQQDRDGPSPT